MGGGEARTAPGSGRSAGQAAGPPRLPGCGGPAVSGHGLGCLGVPARVHEHLSVVPPRRRRLLIRARQLQPRLQRRCAKPGRSVRAGGAAEGAWTQVRRPRRAGRGALRCTAAGGGPLAAVESSGGTGRGGVNRDSFSPFTPHHHHEIYGQGMLIPTGKMPRWAIRRILGTAPFLLVFLSQHLANT